MTKMWLAVHRGLGKKGGLYLVSTVCPVWKNLSAAHASLSLFVAVKYMTLQWVNISFKSKKPLINQPCATQHSPLHAIRPHYISKEATETEISNRNV